MARELIKARSFKPESRAMIGLVNQIVESYMAQGLRLTLRQLYYQMVVRNVIPNQERAYQNLGTLVSTGRLAGLIDWAAIEDRGRRPQRPGEWGGLDALVRGALHGYRLDRWVGQDHYAELWVEKEALAGVLWPLAQEYHVTLMVNRGYSSQSAMYESAGRFFYRGHDKDGSKDLTLFYLGDHDPSGLDMIRDIEDRLDMFGCALNVRHLAITMDQIEEYQPPPNPAKLTDTRARAYIREHGSESWEVDALDPSTLQDLIREAFEEIVDHDRMDRVKVQEEQDKSDLRDAVRGLLQRRREAEDKEE